MSVDNEGDSHMYSSPEESDNEIQTPAGQVLNVSLSSPPDSQQRNMPTSQAGASIANSNGKRPLNTISNGQDDQDELDAMANGKARQEQPAKTHAESGYTWTKPEDEPGYLWLNKKAQDEMARAADTLVHKDRVILDKYGDPLALARNETSLMSSVKTR